MVSGGECPAGSKITGSSFLDSTYNAFLFVVDWR
jgi:hypothetical protein